MTVQDAIATSQIEDRIVRITVDDFSDVISYIEDCTDTPDGVDCWGCDDSGDFRLLVTVRG